MDHLFSDTMNGRMEWDNLPHYAKERRHWRKKGYNQDAWSSDDPNTFTMIESARHGWLQVTIDQANAAAVSGGFKYSECSYVDADPRSGNEYVYLEEDVDMTAFLLASGYAYFEDNDWKWNPEYKVNHVYLETFRPPGKPWFNCRNYNDGLYGASMTAATFIRNKRDSQ